MTSEGQYAGTQPAETTSGGPTSDGFPPDSDGQRVAGRASAPPPADGYPSSYAPPPPATPNGGSPFVVPAVRTFGPGSATGRPTGTSYGSARMPQPDEDGPLPQRGAASPYGPISPGAAASQYGSVSPGAAAAQYGSVSPAASPFADRPATGSAPAFGQAPPRGNGSAPPFSQAPASDNGSTPPFGPPPGNGPAPVAAAPPSGNVPGSPFGPTTGDRATPGSVFGSVTGNAAPFESATPFVPTSGNAPEAPRSAWASQQASTLPGNGDGPLPQRTPSFVDPATINEFDGFAAGAPGRGMVTDQPPAGEIDPATGRRPGVSAFGDQRVRVPGATLAGLPDVPAPGRPGDSDAPPAGHAEDTGSTSHPPEGSGLPMRAGVASFPTRRGDSGGFPLRVPREPDAQSGGDLPVRGQQAPFGPPPVASSGSPFNAFGVPPAEEVAPHPYGRAAGEPHADPFGRHPGHDAAEAPLEATPHPFGRTAPGEPPAQPFGTASPAPAFGSARPGDPGSPALGTAKPASPAPAFGPGKPDEPAGTAGRVPPATAFGSDRPDEPASSAFGTARPVPPATAFGPGTGSPVYGSARPASPAGQFDTGGEPLSFASAASFDSEPPVSGPAAADAPEEEHDLDRRPGAPRFNANGYPQRVPGAALGAAAGPVPQPRDPGEHPAPAVGSARPVSASASVPTASRVAPVEPDELPPPAAAPQARVYGRPAAAPPAEFPEEASGDVAERREPATAPVSPFVDRSDDDWADSSNAGVPTGFGSPAYPQKQGDHSGATGTLGEPAAPGVVPQSPDRPIARASASARVAPPPPPGPEQQQRSGPPYTEFTRPEPAARGAAPGYHPEQYSELTTDIAGREQPHVPGQPHPQVPAFPAAPPPNAGQPEGGDMRMGGVSPGPAGRATVTPPGPNDTTSWPGPEQSKFDQFKPGTEAAPAKPDTPHVRMLPILLSVVIGGVLLLGIVFGIVYLVAGGNDTLSVSTGDCLKRNNADAVKANCGDGASFEVVSIVDDKAKCADPQQPYVINPTSDGKSQILCLKPNG